MSHHICQLSGCSSSFANGLGDSEWFIGVPTVGHISCGTAAPRHWPSQIVLCPSRSAIVWLKELCQCTSIHCLPGVQGSLAALSIKSSVRKWSALLMPRRVLAKSFKRICALSLLEGCSPSWFTLACLVIQALHCKRPTKSDCATSLRSLPLDIWHLSLRMTPRR